MRRSPLAIVYLTVFIDLLGFGIILPALPFYAVEFGATGILVGVLLASYSATQFVGAAVMGRLSDRFGRRPVLLLSLLGSAASLVVSGLAPSLSILILGRSLAGLFGGSIAAAQAYIADVTRPTERAKYMGYLGAAIGLGFVFGPAVGAGLSGFGFGAAAFAAAGLAGANFVFALFALPESRRPVAPESDRSRLTLANLGRALATPTVGRLLVAGFLATFAMVSMEAVAALAGQTRFGLGPRDLGVGFFLIGVVTVAVQAGLVGRVVARYGERSVGIAGAVLMGISLAALPLAPTVGLALLVALLLSAGHGLINPSLAALLSRASDAEQQGGVLGIGQSVSAFARMVGPLVAGWLFDLSETLPFVLGGSLLLLTAWILRDAAGGSPRHRAIDFRRAVPVRVEAKR